MGLAFSLAMVDIINIYREKKEYKKNKDYMSSNDKDKDYIFSNGNKTDTISAAHTFDKPTK
tara:strand:- start:750 stop:932 length:183 start_codon:yes stop_codon:yes gene_type:complete